MKQQLITSKINLEKGRGSCFSCKKVGMFDIYNQNERIFKTKCLSCGEEENFKKINKKQK